MAQFKLKTIFPGVKRIFGMTTEIYNENGDLLGSIGLNNASKKLLFKFNKEDAFQGLNQADLQIKLVDNNGEDFNFTTRRNSQLDLNGDDQSFPFSIFSTQKRARVKIKNINSISTSPLNLDRRAPVFTSGFSGSVNENVAPGTLVYDTNATDASAISFALKDGDSSDFTIDANTGEVTVNKSPDFETKPSYSFNVVATDAQGRATTQAITISVKDIQEGAKILLTPLFDNITSVFELTSQDDVITAELGSLNNGDTINDGFTTDNDKLLIKTNGTNSLIDALDASIISGIQNIETIQVTANNDRGGGLGQATVDLSKISNLKKLDIDGSFIESLVLNNWVDTGATEFDFSGITSRNGVNMTNNNFTSNSAPITIKGSKGDDMLQAVNADLIQGNGGTDILIGSSSGNSILEGGAGRDEYRLPTGFVQTTIRLHGQTKQTSRDYIFGADGELTGGFGEFSGYDDNFNRNNNSYDLIEIDALTFKNYTANTTISRRDQNAIDASRDSLKNTVVVFPDRFTLETRGDYPNASGLLGFTQFDGTLHYSASGDFTTDTEELLQIGAVASANFNPAAQIKVV